jgi:hypothetical protein
MFTIKKENGFLCVFGQNVYHNSSNDTYTAKGLFIVLHIKPNMDIGDVPEFMRNKQLEFRDIVKGLIEKGEYEKIKEVHDKFVQDNVFKGDLVISIFNANNILERVDITPIIEAVNKYADSKNINILNSFIDVKLLNIQEIKVTATKIFKESLAQLDICHILYFYNENLKNKGQKKLLEDIIASELSSAEEVGMVLFNAFINSAVTSKELLNVIETLPISDEELNSLRLVILFASANSYARIIENFYNPNTFILYRDFTVNVLEHLYREGC